MFLSHSHLSFYHVDRQVFGKSGIGQHSFVLIVFSFLFWLEKPMKSLGSSVSLHKMPAQLDRSSYYQVTG